MNNLFVDLHTCIQGEGKYTGIPHILARVSGCNLKCTWCDTPYSSHNPEKARYSISDLIELKEKISINYLMLTGGEPFLYQKYFQDLPEFQLTTIETNGTILNDVDISNYFLSISPKLESSGNKAINLSVFDKYINEAKDYQFKFVITDIELDIQEMLLLKKALNIPNDKIYLMPNAINKQQLELNACNVYEIALQHGLNYTDRLHLRIYDNKRES